MAVIPKQFYMRDPAQVARDLLGAVIVRVYEGIRLACIIVETEAYYGIEDPASRARRGGDLARTLYGDVGVALVYGVHRQWLFNIVAHGDGSGGAVLIRAAEPVEGTEVMMRLRGVRSLSKLMNGPGRLSAALAIDKYFHKKPVYVRSYGLWLEPGRRVNDEDVVRARRVGVSADLEKPLRFYIRGSPYVSKR